MTYLRNGVEYLDAMEHDVYGAIKALVAARRTVNNSQIAAHTGISRTQVAYITSGLRLRGIIENVSTGAAYHWRLTSKPVQLREPGLDEIPEKVTHYFERRREDGQRPQLPSIVQMWIPGQRFEDIPAVPATYTAIRELKAKGAEQVSISCYGHGPADFTIRELLAEADRPLLGGSLIGSKVRNKS
jgi:hypothetical protein